MNLDFFRKDFRDLQGEIPVGSVDFIYVDPPFNTGKAQMSSYGISYQDNIPNMDRFLEQIVIFANAKLKDTGSVMIHLDWRSIYMAKKHLDSWFGPENFINEIIWSFDMGGKPKRFWPRKHNTILWYVKDNTNYTFNYDAIDIIPKSGQANRDVYFKGKTGKIPTSVWEIGNIPGASKERNGYPTQKPIKLLTRILNVHTNPGDTVLDFFAGSGTTGEVALVLGRNCILADKSEYSQKIIEGRLKYLQGKHTLNYYSGTSGTS